MGRGDAATWIFRGDVSRRRRGRDLDSPRRWIAATPRRWIVRGGGLRRRRGRDVDVRRRRVRRRRGRAAAIPRRRVAATARRRGTSRPARPRYGATSVITPFNFPLEIPALQSLASVYMGNKCTVKVDERVQIVYEQFLRMCLACGLPPRALDLIYCAGPVCNELLVNGDAKMTLFTGSQHVAEKLTLDLRGRVKLEDAGFDWKILGPDVADEAYVTWQADQDAYPRPRGNRVAGGRHPSASRPSCPRAPRRRRDVSRRVPAASPRLVSPPSSPRPRPRLVADSPRPPAAAPPRRVSTDVPGRGADLPPGTGTRSRARSARRSPSASCTRTGSGRASSTR